MTPTFIAIVNAISLSLQVAKAIEPVVAGIQTWIKSLFDGGVITKEEQDQLMSYVDNVLSAFQSGQIPEWWKVQPDPQ